MKLIIDISEEAYKEVCGSYLSLKSKEEMRIAIKNGTPLRSVTNAEEAEDYPINQEENCKIVREFLRDIANVKDLPPCKEGIDNLPLVQPKRQTWIPVRLGLPEDLEPVNITWVNHEPEPYYHDIKDKNFVATGIHFRGQWYWYSTTCADYLGEYGSNEVDEVDDVIEIVAWMPLPEPYKAESEDKE